MAWYRVLKRLPIWAVFFTYVFVTSALLATGLCLLLLVIWPFSKTLYRKIVSLVAYSVLGQLVWASEDWAGMKVYLYGDEGVYDKVGEEFSLMALSHRGDLDWMAGYVMASHFNFMHTIRTLPKKSVLFVPGFGQLLWALECCFLSRNSAKDMDAIRRVAEIYRDYPFPIQVCIFCEGTRFTHAKYRVGIEYAKQKGLKQLKYHLLPRTKGFAALAHHLKAKANFPALYDITFAYPHLDPMTEKLPGFWDLLQGQPVEIAFYMRRIPMEEVPESLEELNAYCYKLYERKDEAYDYFVKNGVFPGVCHPWPPTRWKVSWGLRISELTWVSLVLSPWLYLAYSLSWAGFLWLCGGITAMSTLLMLGMLLFVWYPRTHARKIK